MQSRLAFRWIGLFAVCCLSTAAIAQSPDKVFAGKVLLSVKEFPSSSKSQKFYVEALRKQSASNFYENTEKKQWKIFFAAFFRNAPEDIEVQVKVYDITNEKKLIGSFDQYLNARGQKSFISSMVLTEKQFGTNKELMVTLENRGKILASNRFKILGKMTKQIGKVEFSTSGSGKKKKG